MSGKIDPKKPYLEFTFEDDGSITGEAHNTNLPVQKCARLTLDLLEEAIGKDNIQTGEIKPKLPPKQVKRTQQRKQQLGG